MDLTETVERKTSLLFKMSTLTEEVCKRLRPEGTWPPMLYGLPKIHKEDAPLRPIVSNTGAPTHEYLVGLLNPLVGLASHHVGLFTL